MLSFTLDSICDKLYRSSNIGSSTGPDWVTSSGDFSNMAKNAKFTVVREWPLQHFAHYDMCFMAYAKFWDNLIASNRIIDKRRFYLDWIKSEFR